jgi:hypothetical protein
MREAASLRCNGGEARVASGRGVTTVLRSEAAMAWAQEGRSGGSGWRVADEGPAWMLSHRGAHPGTASPPCCAARLRWRGREGRKNDNYKNGGDDNYLRVVEMGPRDERKDVVGTGRNSCR